MLWHIELKFCIRLCYTVLQIKFECREFASIFVGVMPLLELSLLGQHSFLQFSRTCFGILSWIFVYYFHFKVQNKLECDQFSKIFVGILHILELRILEIHGFPHFYPSRFDILSWNRLYDVLFTNFRYNSKVVNLCQFLSELCPLWNPECRKYIVFYTFLLHALTDWAEILYMSFLLWTSDFHYLVSGLKELCPLWMYSFAQFSCACFEIELKFLFF